MARVIFQNVTKLYGGNPVPAVNDLSMEAEDQEFLVLVGPSGCGKSTAMRMVAGLEEISGGQIIIGDLTMITMFMVSDAPTRPLAVIAIAASLTRIACSITTMRHATRMRSRSDYMFETANHDAQ